MTYFIEYLFDILKLTFMSYESNASHVSISLLMSGGISGWDLFMTLVSSMRGDRKSQFAW